MECPLCNQLRRDFSAESNREAAIILEQRLTCICKTPPGSSQRYTELQSVAETSRKRQAHLSEELREHMEGAHAVA